MMKADNEFALLVGKAFLHELEVGHTESAVAFGRALLIAIGCRGPEQYDGDHAASGANGNREMVAATN